VNRKIMVSAEFCRMVLTGSPVPPRTPAAIDIVPYARANCHDEICRIYAEAFGDEPWPPDWEEFDGFDPSGVFLARDHSTGTFVGFVICYRRGDSGYISVAAVVPGFRKRKIGSALIHKAIEYLRSLQLTHVMIDVGVGNTAARETYMSLGFEAESNSIGS